MTFSITYQPIFKIDVLHLFFLNKGTLDYFSMTDKEKSTQLLNYNISDFFRIKPTKNTVNKLKGRKLVYRNSSSELMVWSQVSEADKQQPFVLLEDNLELTFIIQLTDTYFLNYTNLELEDAANIYYFSNQRLSTESNTFPLLQTSGNNNTVNSDFVLSATSAANELKQLTNLEKSNLFGIIRIYIKGENAGLDVTNNAGKIQQPEQSFQLVFENRKTFWRYIFAEEQTVKNKDDVEVENGNAKTLISKTAQPLTQNGFVSIEHGTLELPNPEHYLIKPNKNNNKIYSEIYL